MRRPESDSIHPVPSPSGKGEKVVVRPDEGAAALSIFPDSILKSMTTANTFRIQATTRP